MATSSIFSNVNVRDKAFCRSFINALENSKTSKVKKEVVLSKSLEELKDDQIKKLFEKDDERI